MKLFEERNPLIIGAIGVALIAGVVVGALNYNKLPIVNRKTEYSAYFAEAGGLLTGEHGSPLFPLDPDGYHGEPIAFLAGDPLAHDQARRDLVMLA